MVGLTHALRRELRRLLQLVTDLCSLVVPSSSQTNDKIKALIEGYKNPKKGTQNPKARFAVIQKLKKTSGSLDEGLVGADDGEGAAEEDDAAPQKRGSGAQQPKLTKNGLKVMAVFPRDPDDPGQDVNRQVSAEEVRLARCSPTPC